MNNVLVKYPSIFLCYPKLKRKLLRILSGLHDIEIVCQEDWNGFANRLCSDMGWRTPCNKPSSIDAVRYAIFFDDGQEYSTEIEAAKKAGIQCRVVHVPLTRVVNINVEKAFQGKQPSNEYEYIGRGSYWGNPYSMHEDGESRDEVIRLFRYDFERDLFPRKRKSEALKLRGKRLGCFCKPEACHGDVIAEYLNAWDDGV